MRLILLAALLAVPARASSPEVQFAYKAFEHGQVSRAIALARPFAEKGDALAQTLMGNIAGASGDFRTAASWYSRAAAGGETNAMVALAGLKAQGKGVAKDRLEAENLFRAAAARGNALALYTVARMTIVKDPRHRDAGLALLERSARAGSARAVEDLSRLLNKSPSGYDPLRGLAWMLLDELLRGPRAAAWDGRDDVIAVASARDVEAARRWAVAARDAMRKRRPFPLPPRARPG